MHMLYLQYLQPCLLCGKLDIKLVAYQSNITEPTWHYLSSYTSNQLTQGQPEAYIDNIDSPITGNTSWHPNMSTKMRKIYNDNKENSTNIFSWKVEINPLEALSNKLWDEVTLASPNLEPLKG